jgi:hypothetical protein
MISSFANSPIPISAANIAGSRMRQGMNRAPPAMLEKRFILIGEVQRIS